MSRASVRAVPTAPTLPPSLTIPDSLVGDLRSNHAGESGAVSIYQGILAASRDARVHAFAQRHLTTEREHLALIASVFPKRLHSRLLPVWRLAGFITGWLPALLGPGAVFATIHAVETFVDHHYQEQVDKIDQMLSDPTTAGTARGDLEVLRQLITYCQADEIHHRDEAGTLAGPTRSVWVRAWCWMVEVGSTRAVTLARAF